MTKTLTTQVLIVDDHALFRAGLMKLFEAKSDVEIAGQLESGEGLLEYLDSHLIDIVILDISLPGLNGLKLLAQIKEKFPHTKVLILSMHKVAEYCRLALRQGASGYILKEDAFNQVAAAIDAIVSGGQYISPSITAAAAQSFLANENSLLPDVLTKMERVVLEKIASGMSNKEVAKNLEISVRTVETHRAHVLRKLGIKNTAGLVQYAVQHHLIRIEKA